MSETALDLKYSEPCKGLKGLVHSSLQISTNKATPYPIMPDATQAIFISVNGSMLGGAQRQACEILLPEPGEYFGIRFYPGALRHFFKLDLSEITSQFVGHKYFPTSSFKDLHQAIYQYSTFRQRAEVCEKWLLQRYKARSAHHFEQAMSSIYQASGRIKMRQLLANVGRSSRHLNRLFKRYTELSSKEFSQIVRIQNICRQLYQTPGRQLDIALELGYFDQSHLIKDFKKRLFSTPNLFFESFMSDFYNK